MEPVTQLQMLSRFLGGLPWVAGKALQGFARWYWRLNLVGQLFVTAAAVPLADVVLQGVGVSAAQGGEMVVLVGVALLGTAIAATLAHGAGGVRPP